MTAPGATALLVDVGAVLACQRDGVLMDLGLPDIDGA
jgi:hypothetical protein